MALAGILILSSESIGGEVAKIFVPIAFAVAGMLAYLFSSANPQHNIARQYHLLQGVGMIVFALTIGLGANDLSDFLSYTTYFILFFGLMEILFAFMALNSSQKLNTGILISRFIAGFTNLIGAVVLLATSATSAINGLMIAGVLILLGGLAFVMFSFRIRRL